MASESIDSSDGDVRTPGRREGTPYAARSPSGPAARPAWFPLGYKEGFSQWVWITMHFRE